MQIYKCEVLPRLPEGRTLSYLKGTLNGRGGPKAASLVCGSCEFVIMSSAPSRPIDLVISCPQCKAINDLTTARNHKVTAEPKK